MVEFSRISIDIPFVNPTEISGGIPGLKNWKNFCRIPGGIFGAIPEVILGEILRGIAHGVPRLISSGYFWRDFC